MFDRCCMTCPAFRDESPARLPWPRRTTWHWCVAAVVIEQVRGVALCKQGKVLVVRTV